MIVEDANLKELIQRQALELRASEARFHNVVSLSTDGILIVNGLGTILFVNPAAIALFGLDEGQLLGEQFGFPIVAGATTELDIATRKGIAIVAEMKVAATEWEGKPAYLANLRDITERISTALEIIELNRSLAEKADELETANQELKAFNYTVAHDLRQPLNLLGMYCQSLNMLCHEQLGAECLGYVQKAHDTTLGMNRLIETLLNFSHVGRVTPRLEYLDFSAMARVVAEELKQAEPDRTVDFSIPDGIEAQGDADLLKAVLANLFGNAWKYTRNREKGYIEFGVRDIDGVTTYFVRDNGTGFAMADAPKLFIPFERLPDAQSSSGFGIGLATVERIIRRHGGKVWAEGEPDKGACFYFTLH